MPVNVRMKMFGAEMLGIVHDCMLFNEINNLSVKMMFYLNCPYHIKPKNIAVVEK